ncbi:MAG: hypothetical protein JNK04_11210 [Myxococcales bacterium]|nr:hypothetical protein [Myxococcales bacterium]
MARDVLKRALGCPLRVGWLSLLVVACSEESRPPSAQSIPEPEVPALASVRRPAERFIMERTGERCEIRIVRGGPVPDELVKEVACPLELELGESIQATGMTCMRVSAVKARNIPVVCPSTLNVAVREFRKQAAASASANRAP